MKKIRQFKKAANSSKLNPRSSGSEEDIKTR
jgi:hypothetical protein